MPAIAAIAPHHKAIEAYYAELADYAAHYATYEQATRAAFEHLLRAFQSIPGWTLLLEQPLANGKRPDGTFRDTFNLPRGYWEAKDTADDLDAEITKKLQAGYPTTNIIFEDTRRAVLYQDNRRVDQFDLTDRRALAGLLTAFFGYAEAPHENFYAAVAEFKERVPDLAKGLLERIRQEHAAHNPAFSTAWANFYQVCKESLDPSMRSETVDEMLVQHLLTERLFRTVFDNPDFVRRNVIAAEIEKVIDGLTSRAFNRAEFTRALDRFYLAIEGAAPTDWSEKQAFMNMVYERFFQGFSVKQADTHGIVYTPQEIVDFMCASVEEVLRAEFGTSLSTPGVQVLDPATGTGSFIANILRRISGVNLETKYRNDLFANEIMLLPYYIASLNIEHTYYERTGQYLPFDGLCFADTLDMEGQQMMLFTERNTERVRREKDAQIMVVIGNPPYNAWQKNENDNNKNRKYLAIDNRLAQTYVKDSTATLRTSLYDPYVRFFRWATDRLQGRDGVVCFVSNNSFTDQIAFDGMRKHLLQDFTRIYHLDLHGNVRKNPKLSGTTHNVFGIQVGVGITIAVRSSTHAEPALLYYRVPEGWRKDEKFAFLTQVGSVEDISWQDIQPDEKYSWITGGIRPEFAGYIPIGTKEAKRGREADGQAIFKDYGNGVKTNRDSHVYSFAIEQLRRQAQEFIEIYNTSVDKLRRIGGTIDAEVLVESTGPKIKWTRQVKESLVRQQYSEYDESHIRRCLYRPFVRMHLYFDGFWNEDRYRNHLSFPSPRSEGENAAIWLKVGSEWPMFALATNVIPDQLPQGGSQCFPLYTYDEDGSNRRDNITDWALARFRAAYGPAVTKPDIFAYVYAILHHPTYRARYAENLKRELPRIPLVEGQAAFAAAMEIGRELARLHLEYDIPAGDRGPQGPAHAATAPEEASAQPPVLRP